MLRTSVHFAAPLCAEALTEPLPPGEAGQVLVQTEVSAISAGTELLFYRGQAPVDLPVDAAVGALGQEPPVYAHLPTVLNEQGEKMSKRNGAKPVTQYRDEGYLPDAMVNYLARLGWSHGDDEIFSRAQFLEWFNLDHLGRSAAQFDEAKLRWVNAQHLKAMDDARLAPLVAEQLRQRGAQPDERLPALCGLFKDRCDTTVALADWLMPYHGDVTPAADELAKHLTEAVRPATVTFAARLQTIDWTAEAIAAALKQTLAEHGLKMPQLAMPVRVLVMGTTQTPSVDAMLALHRRDTVIARLRAA